MALPVRNDVTNGTTSPPTGNNSTSEAAMFTVTDGPIFDAVNEEKFQVNLWPFIFTIFYMLVGFVGNSVVVYIFTCQWKKTKTTVFILTLAFVDLTSCMFNMPVEAAILWSPMTFDQDILCKISRFTTFIVSVSSSFVLVAIAIDRYIMVCRPFQGRTLGVVYAQRTCIVAVLLGTSASWPSLVFYGTNTFNVLKPELSNNTQAEGKTCLITNYYVENSSFSSGFYMFLFIGHIVIFIVLSTLYLLIGRSLFMSTSVDAKDKRRSSLKLFGISVVSAFTGHIPNENRFDVASYRSSALSTENINLRLDDQAVQSLRDNQNGNIGKTESDRNKNVKHLTSPTDAYHQCTANQGQGSALEASDNDSAFQRASDTTAKNVCKSKGECHLNIGLGAKAEGYQRADYRIGNNRFSSESASSDKCLTPETPDSVRAIMYRSQTSIDARSRISRIISEDHRNSGVKEFSLKRNTLIMRMVTVTFIISFLPYLVLVTIRYSNKDVPDNLSMTAQIVYHVFLRSYFINSMINPFIYGFMNEEFRAKLKALLRCKCSRIPKI